MFPCNDSKELFQLCSYQYKFYREEINIIDIYWRYKSLKQIEKQILTDDNLLFFLVIKIVNSLLQ